MRFINVAHRYINNIDVENTREGSKVSVRLKMYFHRRQTCTKRLSKPKFVTCNLKSELKFFQPYTTQTNMKVHTLKSRNKHWLCPIFWMNLRSIDWVN